MKKYWSQFLVITLFGCAQQVAPTGGPKDEKPPEILLEEPKNQSVNFAATQIEIKFDEFIQLKSPAEEILISPPMLKAPSYQLKQKSLIIKFQDMLAPNTTYTINFGEAIRDNNEGNILPNYSYVFSTGAKLDSMQLRGRVSNALTGDPVENALVMLYKNDVDSLPLDTLPNYFARTSKDGSYQLKFLSDQHFKIFALKDENSNYRFDVPNEMIGFLDTLVVPFHDQVLPITDSLLADSTKTLDTKPKQTSYELIMFVEEDTTQYLKKAYCDYFGRLVFVYNRPVSKLKASVDGLSFKKQWMLRDYSIARDTVTLWITETVPDTMSLILQSGMDRTDTVELVMKPRAEEILIEKATKGKGKMKQAEKFALTARTHPAPKTLLKPNIPLILEWNHPILNADLARVKLYEDSLRVKFHMSSNDTALRLFRLEYTWKKGKNYRLLVLDSAFTDMYGLWNDTIDFSFVGTDKTSFGELSLKVNEAPSSPLLVEVMASNKKVVGRQSVRRSGVVKFEGLEPGKYDISVVEDLNGNGRWDSGRYAIKRQPEPIRVIERGAEVRPNWELELEWDPTTD